MPEPASLLRQVLAVAALAVVATLAATPVALAQTDGAPGVADDADDGDAWAASAFDPPFDEDDPVVRDHQLSVAGTLRYDKQVPTERIASATIRLVDDPEDDFEPPAACELPAPVTVDNRPGYDEDGNPMTGELRFPVDGTAITFDVACNGRYLLEAEGQLAAPADERHTLRHRVVVHVLPPAVTGLGVSLEAEARQATVTFTPVPDDELPPDALGYVVERAGPADDSGAVGMYEEVAAIGLDAEPRVVDDLTAAAPGTYAYRVRSARAGADGPVLSSIIDGDSERIALEGPPRTSTSTTADAAAAGGGRERARAGTGRVRMPSRPSTPRLTTPTTLDTGFEETLDYGEALPQGTGAIPGEEPLAGQSIVRDEGESVDLVAPAAGALVLLGWAGHIVYLNRLARQL